MPFQIKLNVFEGPYDLLLFLIKKGEVDIYDIPIAKVTKEYLEYIELMKSLELEIAGEFILVAATLMRIKAKMLLPVYVEDDEEYEDPRQELVQNLLEYQRIKEAAFKLEKNEFDRRKLFSRGKEIKLDDDVSLDEIFETQLSIYQLIKAYNHVLKKDVKTDYHYVEPEPVTIDEQMENIMRELGEKKRISFSELILEIQETFLIIVNFLALLELAKRSMIKIGQSKQFNDIWIYKRK